MLLQAIDNDPKAHQQNKVEEKLKRVVEQISNFMNLLTIGTNELINNRSMECKCSSIA